MKHAVSSKVEARSCCICGTQPVFVWGRSPVAGGIEGRRMGASEPKRLFMLNEQENSPSSPSTTEGVLVSIHHAPSNREWTRLHGQRAPLSGGGPLERELLENAALLSLASATQVGILGEGSQCGFHLGKQVATWDNGVWQLEVWTPRRTARFLSWLCRLLAVWLQANDSLFFIWKMRIGMASSSQENYEALLWRLNERVVVKHQE